MLVFLTIIRKYKFLYDICICRLNVMVYYDEAFYKRFGTRSRTRAMVIMALAAEQYLEPSFKTRLEITVKDTQHAVGYDWGNLTWNTNNDFR